MATPILKIPVDDSAFKKYLETFNAYQKQLEAQPDVWKEINSTTQDFAAIGLAVAAGITFQAEETARLAAEEKKRHDAQKKANHEQEEDEKKSANRRQRAIAQAKEYARSLADAAGSVAKWASVDALLGAATSVLGLWGLDRVAGSVANEYRTAQGMGVGMGKMQGMGLSMQRYFDVNSVMENVANMQGNPASWGTFRMMGVNPTGKDPAALTGELALSARRMFLADKGNLMLAGAQGLTSVFSPDELRRLAATPEKELRGSLGAATKFNGMDDAVGKKWQDLSVTMGYTLKSVENTLLGDLMKLNRNHAIDHVIEAFGKLAESGIKSIDWNALGKGIGDFSKYLTDGQFKNDFRSFISDISAAAHALHDALVWLHVIPSNKPSGVSHLWDAPGSDAGNGGKPHPWISGGSIKGAAEWLGTGAYRVLSGTAEAVGVAGGLMAGVFGAESSFGRNAGRSSAGALGPFQMMSGTAARYGVTDRSSYDQESKAAAHYMRDLLHMFHGDERKAIAAYNWGEGNVQKDVRRHGDRWLDYAPAETQRYVAKVLSVEALAARRQGAAHGVNVHIHNHTGASVATTVNSMAGG